MNEPRPEELRASISRLMRGLNHDLKNPLGAADGYLDLMLQGFRGDLTGEQRQTIERVRTLVGSAVDILEDVVTFARATLGELRVRLSESDLNAVARIVVEEHRERAQRSNLKLHFVRAEADVRTVTDADLTGQILRQILANALDNTPDGGRIEVRLERAADSIAITVADTGPGVPEEARERIFLEFERGAAPARTRETAGIGFGLPLARALADRLDGTLELDPSTGNGATFRVVLPARQASAPAGGEAGMIRN